MDTADGCYCPGMLPCNNVRNGLLSNSIMHCRLYLSLEQNAVVYTKQCNVVYGTFRLFWLNA